MSRLSESPYSPTYVGQDIGVPGVIELSPGESRLVRIPTSMQVLRELRQEQSSDTPALKVLEYLLFSDRSKHEQAGTATGKKWIEKDDEGNYLLCTIIQNNGVSDLKLKTDGMFRAIQRPLALKDQIQRGIIGVTRYAKESKLLPEWAYEFLQANPALIEYVKWSEKKLNFIPVLWQAHSKDALALEVPLTDYFTTIPGGFVDLTNNSSRHSAVEPYVHNLRNMLDIEALFRQFPHLPRIQINAKTICPINMNGNCGIVITTPRQRNKNPYRNPFNIPGIDTELNNKRSQAQAEQGLQAGSFFIDPTFKDPLVTEILFERSNLGIRRNYGETLNGNAFIYIFRGNQLITRTA